MNKIHTDKINQLTTQFLQDENSFNLTNNLHTYVKENCADLDASDKVKVIAQTIPLIFVEPCATSEEMEDGYALHEVTQAINYVVSDEVFDSFVYETKIELTEENKSDIEGFFSGKDNWQSDEYRKEGLATLIEALLKSYNSL